MVVFVCEAASTIAASAGPVSADPVSAKVFDADSTIAASAIAIGSDAAGGAGGAGGAVGFVEESTGSAAKSGNGSFTASKESSAAAVGSAKDPAPFKSWLSSDVPLSADEFTAASRS